MKKIKSDNLDKIAGGEAVVELGDRGSAGISVRGDIDFISYSKAETSDSHSKDTVDITKIKKVKVLGIG